MKDLWINWKDIVATPFGIMGLLAIIAAWVHISYQRNRLNKIGALPRNERIEALKREYSTFPRSDLSGDKWIKARLHSYIFWGVITTLLLSAIVVMALEKQT
jgi:hypothetical protein